MMKKYKFRKYDKKFPELFRRERLKLMKILPGAKIEHIGSTSVKGLGGKGIVDIMISINKDNVEKARDKLTKSGYLWKEKAGEGKVRLFFEKDYKSRGKIRRVHLQLTYHDSKIWNNTIKTREILRNSKEKVRKYSKIKKKAVKLGKVGEKYREYKNKFLRALS